MAGPPFDLTDIDRLTLDLERLLGRAVLLTRESDESEDVQINFTTLLLAFLISDDRVSRWFQQYVRAAGVSAERIYTSKSIEPGVLDQVRYDEAPEKLLYLIREVTYSAGAVLRQAAALAERLAPQSGGYASQVGQYERETTRLDVYHVMGAYIYYPSGHEEQLAEWGVDREHWAEAFLAGIIRPDFGEQLEAWQEIHIEAFGSRPRLDSQDEATEQPPVGTTEGPNSAPEFPLGGPSEVPPPATPTERLAGFDADRATGRRADDLLNITPDVNALAALIAAKHTVPSLAIGIFGDWGSGKTFFMRSLMRRIDELTAAARSPSVGEQGQPVSEQPQSKITFYKRIVQIEFNAWHYVEGNLWASLVEHILRNLRISQDPDWDPDGTRLETLQAHVLKQLEGAQQEQQIAEQEVQAAKAKLAKAEGTLARLERERAEKQRELDDLTALDVLKAQNLEPVVEAVRGALKAAGLPEVTGGLQEMQAALAEGRALFQRGRAVAAPLLRAEDKGKRLWLLIVSLVAGPALGLLGALIAWWTARPESQALWTRIAGLASGSAGFLGLVANWLRAQVNWTSGQLSKLESASQQLETLQAEMLKEYDLRIDELKGQVAALDESYSSAQERAAAARQEVQKLEEQLRQAAPAHRLARFIEDRTDSDDYRRHLGLLAQVRRDFQTLSEYIERQNQDLETFESLDEELDGVDERINRIVLYVDDLDRCPAENVVQVLQAVHLLLAFPLFVAVVGVDARWVSRALEERYPHLRLENEKDGGEGDLLGFGRAATPHDYLEKIFQIPIWLHPIGEHGSRDMLDGLLKDKVVPPPGPDATGRDRLPADESAGGQQREEQRPEGEPPEEEPPQEGPPEGQAPEEPPSEGPPPKVPPPEEEASEGEPAEEEPAEEEPPIDLTPESLEIVSTELAFMKELAGIVGRSPRVIKRYVNLYRLLKATLEQTEAPLAVGTPLVSGRPTADGTPLPAVDCPPLCDHEVVLFLLAIVTGLPDISRRVFETIREGANWNRAGLDPQRDLRWVLDQLPDKAAGIRGAETDLERLGAWLSGYQDGAWLAVPLDCLDRRAGQVGRYSFRVEQR